MKKPKPPKSLDAITDLVLAYRPKPKSKPAKKRKRRATKAYNERKLAKMRKYHSAVRAYWQGAAENHPQL